MRKNMKVKGLTLVLTASILASLLAGCGMKDESAVEAPAADYEYVEETTEECYEAEDYTEAEQSLMQDSVVTNGAMEYRDVMPEYYEEDYNSEEYEKAEENGFCMVTTQPLSTFSADVDTASYANIRRMIEDGYTLDDINPDAVRAEEFINYFSYDLNLPKRNEKFGVTTEVAPCPWNDDHHLMMVGMRTEAIDLDEAPDNNLVFLLDVSGSMSDPDKLPLLQDSFKELVEELDEDDIVSIVTYANGVDVVLSGANGNEKEEICDAIDSLYASGATNGEGGIQKAYRLAEANFIEGGNNRIILATDGDLNVGISEPDELERLIEDKRDSGVYLSVLGFGTGNIKDNNMERLADCGNGNYAYIDSLFEAKKVMVEEMGATFVTVAEDVKLQVEFNPATVNAYRLIGYENRMLEATDFNDDKKDAGEIGAGHTVVALYEIIPAGSEDEIVLKYQQSKEDVAHTDEKVSDDFATVSVRYKEPGKNRSQLESYVVGEGDWSRNPSDDFIFASLVAEFAMILSDSPNKGDATLEGILDEYEMLDVDDEYKDEFYYMVKMLAKRR
ncbi:MAG: VWA domain-containing protein [Lachnospiraceae bacterium]|nr:VWA domain-containing protein [Lachnospiraceae bacterium]